jgi:hypothetical protein
MRRRQWGIELFLPCWVTKVRCPIFFYIFFYEAEQPLDELLLLDELELLVFFQFRNWWESEQGTFVIPTRNQERPCSPSSGSLV